MMILVKKSKCLGRKEPLPLGTILGLLWDKNGNKFAGCDGKMVVRKIEYHGFGQLSLDSCLFCCPRFPYPSLGQGTTAARTCQGYGIARP
jgi:hypothetical protein